MEHDNGKKTKWIGTHKPTNKLDVTTIIYVSPDKLELTLAYLNLKNHRPLINVDKETRDLLEDIAEKYDNDGLNVIGIVRAKNFIGTRMNYVIDYDVKPVKMGEETLRFGPYKTDEITNKIGIKKLESMVNSDYHLIE